jgi:hypothetical protein
MTVQAIAVKAGTLVGVGVARLLIANHAIQVGVTRARAMGCDCNSSSGTGPSDREHTHAGVP